MDLLFKRYASPFLIIDQMLVVGRFFDFIKELHEIMDGEKTWEFYLHKIYQASFDEFKEGMQSQPENHQMSLNDIETTVNDTISILNNFTPENL